MGGWPLSAMRGTRNPLLGCIGLAFLVLAAALFAPSAYAREPQVEVEFEEPVHRFDETDGTAEEIEL